MSGYIKLFRKFDQWGWASRPDTSHLFIWLLISANWKENTYMGEVINRGSLVFGLDSFSRKTGLSIQRIRTALKHLKSTSEITVKSTNQFSVITITNFENYQDDNTPLNKRITNEEQTDNNQLTTLEEYKNIKKGRKNNTFSGSPEFVQEVVNYLNLKAGTKYKSNIKKTVSFICARSIEGFSVTDFKAVIDSKCSQWIGDEKMEQYLRPETLFGTKFESYLNGCETNLVQIKSVFTDEDLDRAEKEWLSNRQKTGVSA